MPKKGEKIRIFTEKDKQEIIKLYMDGTTQRQIQEIYHCSGTAISEILQGVYSPKIGRPKFSKEKEKEICEMYLTGKYNKKFIAEKYGCCIGTVINILKRHNVKIVPHRVSHFSDMELRDDFFEEIDSEEKAYFLGFMFADGYVYKGSKNAKAVGLEIHIRDIELIHKLKELLNTSNKVKYRKRANTEVCSINVYSTKMANDLEKYGIVQNKTKVTKHLPDIAIPYRRHFLRGLLDGDGWVTIDKKGYFHVGFVSFHKSIAEDFQKACNSLIEDKNHSSITTKGKKCSGYVCAFQSQKQVKQLMTALYKDSTIYLTRKRELVEPLLCEFNNDDDIV